MGVRFILNVGLSLSLSLSLMLLVYLIITIYMNVKMIVSTMHQPAVKLELVGINKNIIKIQESNAYGIRFKYSENKYCVTPYYCSLQY